MRRSQAPFPQFFGIFGYLVFCQFFYLSQEMGYDFVALPLETGGRQSEEAEQFLDRLVKYAGSGDSSDEARFRHFAATSLMMTNQIGVARTILANLPIGADRG